jgi:hypothetical protein
MKTPRAISAMTPRAAPTPIPAFAPVDRLPLSSFGGVGIAEAVEEPAVGEVVVDDGIEELVSAPTNTGSTRYFARLVSVQHASESPQHHQADVLVLSQGVTLTSFLRCSACEKVSVCVKLGYRAISYFTRTQVLATSFFPVG